MTLKKLLVQAIIFWAVLTLTIMYFIDFKLPSAIAISDYLMTFHTAGWIAAHDKWAILYPPADATAFHGAPFDQLSHQLLPNMPATSVSEYMYMPMSALVFAPYSALKIEFSLLAWQLTSLAAIFASTYLILVGSARNMARETESAPKIKLNKLYLSLTAAATLSFLPVCFTLWIGQVGLVFGLLPLAAGFYFLGSIPFLAGIVFSLLFLKPQMLFLAVFLIVSELAQKRVMALVGMCVGVMFLAQSNAIVFGPEVFQAWLNCLKLSDKIFSDPANGVAIHLATSLPRAVLLSQPVALHAMLKPIVYGLAFLLLALGLGVVTMLSHSSSAIKSKTTKANLSIVIGCLALPLVVPHLFIYDLCTIVPAFYLVFAAWDKSLSSLGDLTIQLRRILASYWLVMTTYGLLLITNMTWAKPLLLVSVMTLLYCWALVAIVKYLLKEKKTHSNPDSPSADPIGSNQ
ncbi:MAG: glycosyltransferase family 87 protein [Candidatus Obscuribacterales bacterium]